MSWLVYIIIVLGVIQNISMSNVFLFFLSIILLENMFCIC